MRIFTDDRLQVSPRTSASAFTLVELMVSMTLLTALMVLLVQTVDQTQKVWRRTTEKATQFQGARAAFESMTRRLSQATLNTYWRAFDTDMDAEVGNFRFRRQSELQFLSGSSKRIFSAAPAVPNLAAPIEAAYPTHSIFFQAPLGMTEESVKESGSDVLRFRKLGDLLSGCGYFVEYGPDPDRPEFLENVSAIPDRYRFRLMELTVPAERLNIFKRATDSRGFNDPRIFDENNQFPYVGLVDDQRKPVPGWVRPLWMKDALQRQSNTGTKAGGSHFRFARPRAENVIALIVMPKLAEKDRKQADHPELAPDYEYDSWRILVKGTGTVRDGSSTVKIDNVARDCLLPPIVQVTMIAVDETSMARMDLGKDNIPTWTKGLFQHADTEKQYREDISQLETILQKDGKINYRIFSTDVVIRASKWSRDPFVAQPQS